MAKTTPIEWCDSVVNLQMGCDGCELWNPKAGVKICYAGKIIDRYGGKSTGYPESFDKPKLFLSRLDEVERWADLRGTERPDKPWLNGQPRLIFLDDMGDTFTESLPIDWLAPLLPRMAVLPHIFILLTKRANRMLEFSKTHPFPKNFWLLVSVTSSANYNRIEQLMQVQGGSVKGISYEPAWGPLDITRWLWGRDEPCEDCPQDADCICGFQTRAELKIPRLGWAICGGQSGDSSRPLDLQWPRDIVAQCAPRTDCAVFVKQLGAKPYQGGSEPGTLRTFYPKSDKKGGLLAEFPSDLQVRQFPEIAAR